MALLSDQEVQLRISTHTEGEAGVTSLTASVDDLQKELQAVGESAKKSGEAQAEAAAKLATAKTRLDDVKLSLMSAKNEYKFLAERAKESGAAQSLFADQAAYAKSRIAALNSDLIVTRGTIKLASDEHRAAALAVRNHANEQQRLAEQLRIVQVESLGAGNASDPAAKSVGLLERAFSGLKGIIGGLGIATVGQEFLRANLAADKLQKSLQAVNGDAVKSAADLEFLRETAQRLGLNLESSSSGFVKLSAAAKGTALEGQATRDIFSAIGGAMSQLGLSSADTERAFVAIAQMMSKGTVNAEELKGQLGDVLPGALAIAARATGLTTQELGKLMETGGLLAEDFLPKFAAEVKKSFGGASVEVQGLSQTIERVKNTWQQALEIFGNTGALAALGGIVGVINEGLLLMATGVTTVVASFFAFIKVLGATAAALVTLDFSQLKESLAEIGRELVSNIEKMARLTGTAKLVAEVTTGAGEATEQAATKVAQAGGQWEKLNVAYSQAAKSLGDYVDQVKKTAKANDDQAAVTSKLIALGGTEIEQNRAKEEAARIAADGSARVAAAIDMEAKALQAKAIALQEDIKGQKNVSEEKLKAIEEAKKAAEAKGEEARSALGAADASRVAAAAAQAESAAYADNSKRVIELKDAYDQAQIKLSSLRAAQVAGFDVSKEVKAAEIEAAKAANLYRDALKDQTAAIENNAKVKQAQFDVTAAGIRLQIEQQRSMAEVAKAYGDEATAAAYLFNIKQLEIELAELTAKAKRAEAEAALLVVKAKREELKESGQLTAAKEAELKAQEASSDVKKIEAQIAEETASRMRDLAAATDVSVTSATGAADGFGKLADQLRDVSGAADGAAASIKNVGSSSTRSAAGASAGQFAQSGGATLDFKKLAMGRGASAENVDAVVEAANANLSKILATRAATGATSNEMTLKSLISMAVDGAVGATRTQAITHTINLRFPEGKSKQLNVIGESDVRTLIDVLKEAQGRSIK
jgi:tape measure domain-containing protein